MVRVFCSSLLAAAVLCGLGTPPASAMLGYSDAQQVHWLRSNPGLRNVRRAHSETPVETRNIARLSADIVASGRTCAFVSTLHSGEMASEYSSAHGVVDNEFIRCNYALAHDSDAASFVRAVYGSAIATSFQNAAVKARLVDSKGAAGPKGAVTTYYAQAGAAYAFVTTDKQLSIMKTSDLDRAIKQTRDCFDNGNCGDV